MRFAFIVLVIAIDDVLQTLMTSFTTTYDFIRFRVKWIAQDKLGLVGRGGKR